MALAAAAAGHDVQILPGPSGQVSAAMDHLAQVGEIGAVVDLVIIATPDVAIRDAARRFAAGADGVVCHLSGYTSIDAVEVGSGRFGSLHPLMTRADSVQGAASLVGAPAAVTASDPDSGRLLWRFAESLGMAPFSLTDSAKPEYHAGASVASNVTTGVIALAFDLFRAAGVDPRELHPLVERSIGNAFDLGPDRALTGPVVRGDVTTVDGHLRAVNAIDPKLGGQLELLVAFLSRRVEGR